jgi:CheY-like chemotaxis protein
MSTRLDERKIFLLGFPDLQITSDLQGLINSYFSDATVFISRDGPDTLGKLENVAAHVVLLTSDLPKIDGIRVVTTLLKDKRFSDTAFIFLSPPPEQSVFEDEIITGRIQFLGFKVPEEKIHRSIIKALNVVSSQQELEFRLRFLYKDDPLLKEGDEAHVVYLVRTGQLQAFHRGAKEKVLLGTIEAGEFVGEMAYINDEPRSADVVAVTDCELIEIPLDHLDHLLYRKPAWSKALMVTLSKRIKRANARKIEGAE